MSGEKIFITTVCIILIIFSITGAIYLSKKERVVIKEVCDEAVKPRERADIKACIEEHGIPIVSMWDGSLKRCDFK